MEDKLNRIEAKLDALCDKFNEFKIETAKSITKLQVKTGLFWGLFIGIIAFVARGYIK